ncbi:hypothetical protein ACFXPA_37540 [Amycolatopsis sp. NPDC059090]|uniref:hypothetical protein n=1 Tax=Amycolatopsis sp. NPDC059090 TaxID=3346723 RepID=UPI00366A9DE6
MDPATLNHREHAILLAAAQGRGELLAGCEPSLAIDGGWCRPCRSRAKRSWRPEER